MNIITIVAIVIILLAIVPVLCIWSLNTLFGLGLAYSFKNLVATFILTMVFSSRAVKSSN